MQKKFNRIKGDARALFEEIEGKQARMAELADLMEKENRDMTDAEKKECAELERRLRYLNTKLQSLGSEVRNTPDLYAAANEQVRADISAGKQSRFLLYRSTFLASTAADAGMIPVEIQDIVKPLAAGLIVDKLGLPMPVGLAGDYVWPVFEAGEATVVGEGVALSDATISVDKLTANPQRIGVAYPVSREAINQTEGVIEQVITEILPLMVSKLINKIMLGQTKVANATTLAGPFVGIKSTDVVRLSAEPTFKELNGMKAKVLASGVDGSAMCYVMTHDMKAILEATPRHAGSERAICEDDKICGLPVFCSNYVGAGFVGLGDWRYQPLGLFGQMELIVDPFSQARKNSVDFVLNANFGTVTLRKEAFVLGKVTTA